MVYGAISGMVSALGDPYSMFLPPAQNKVVDEDLSGSFEGVGIEIGYRAAQLAVISPLAGSPAEKAGVKPGDYIIHIKDVKKNIDIGTDGINLSDAVSAIRGPAGTVVTLTLAREGVSTPIVADLTRAKLDVPSVALSFVGDNKDIADIKVSKFGAETTGEWDKAVSAILVKPEVKGIIIDLRNNPGGYLQAAVDLASDFVPIGTTVVIQENGDGTRNEFKSTRLGKLMKYKVVVLINGGSASASEILSGALRDQRQFKLIGEKSFGKGTIQEPVEIPGGSGLHVTTAKWLTPNGIWVHEKGLTPDVTVVAKDTDKTDTQLQTAINQF
jgi:carboxyl-terminal processing protease